MKKRDSYWQIVRGICILAVVMIHCPNALAYSRDSMDYNGWIVLRQIIDFPVPVFVFMAGYFARQDKCLKSPLGYLKTRGGGLLIPYFLWTILYSVISMIHSGRWSDAIPLLLMNLITGKAASPLYYVLLLMQMEILLPIMIKILKKGGFGRIVLWMITPFYLLYVYMYCFLWGEHPTLYGTLFPAYLIFYVIGLEASEQKEYIVKVVRKYGKVIWILFTLGISILEGIIISGINMPQIAVSQMKFSSFLYSITIILFLLKHFSQEEKGIQNYLKKILNIIGNDSYGIFYLHCLIIKIETVVGKRIAVTVPWIVSTLIYCVTAVLICEVVIYCLRKITANSTGNKYLKQIGF